MFKIFKRKPDPIPAPEIKTKVVVAGTRAFAAAKDNRLTMDWAQSIISINEDLRNNLKKLKVRCREASKSNAHVKKYLNMRHKNIVGKNGIKLIANAKDFSGNIDNVGNEIIENFYKEFSEKGNFTVCGKYSRKKVEKLITSCLAYDGEFLAKIVIGSEYKYGMAIQVIDSVLLDIDLNRRISSDRQIIMGVEIDQYSRPVAYWLRKDNYYSYGYMDRHVRVPAEYIIHIMTDDFPNQVRGIPKMATSLTGLNNLGAYTEAEVIAARVSASKMGYYKSEEDEDIPEDEEGATNEVELMQELEPGVLEKLPKGWSMGFFDPTHPNGNHKDFTKVQLREIANGLDVAYNSLGNDLEGVNFSSIRQGVLEEREGWMDEQEDIIDEFERIVFRKFITINLLSGKLAPLPYSKISKFIRCDKWLARRWPWVDPFKDAKTNEIMVDKGWKTDSQVTAEQGGDYYDNIVTIEKETEHKKAHNFGNLDKQANIKTDTKNGDSANEASKNKNKKNDKGNAD